MPAANSEVTPPPKGKVPPPEDAPTPDLPDGLDADPQDMARLMDGLDELLKEAQPAPGEAARHVDRALNEAEALVGEVLGQPSYVGDDSLCPACGAVTSVYSDRCPRCGVMFDTESCQCGHCGRTVPPEALFCTFCAQPLTNPEALCPKCASPVPFSAPECPTCHVELALGEMRCAACGEPVEANAVSCNSCGQLLVEGAHSRSDALARVAGYAAGGGSGDMAGVSVNELKASLDASGMTEVDIENKLENKIEVEANLKTPEVMIPGTAANMAAQATQDDGRRAQREDARAKLAKARNRKADALFPFTAVWGQEKMKTALIVNIIDPLVGGVLISGQKGTGKSVTVRGVTEVTPEIKVVDGCRFSCDPGRPGDWCWECSEKFQGRTPDSVPQRSRPLKVVDLPLNATEDRVVGTLDVGKMLTEGTIAFEHGVLAEANRGVLYVDEINLLDDYVVDVLLDAAAMGVATVEREGISVRYPARFFLVGSMNPEEGSLRPQLLDRIALQVSVTGVEEMEGRLEIIRRRTEFEKDPAAFRKRFEGEQNAMREKIRKSRELLPQVTLAPKLFGAIPKVTTTFGVDGHRADIMIERGSKALAAYEGRTNVTSDDVGRIAEMVLPHRMRRKPFEQAEFSPERLRRVIEENL